MPTASYDPYLMHDGDIEDPPRSLWSALKKIGPGIILAGSIVGSGELLLTTSLGAEHGFAFLWLILFSCVVKVFVQIELGRYAISSGKPTLAALDDLPGPRWRVHWLLWWWFAMLLATVSQLGAMVGGVAQALHLAMPGVSIRLAEWSRSSLPEFIRQANDPPRVPVGGNNSLSRHRPAPTGRLPVGRADNDCASSGSDIRDGSLRACVAGDWLSHPAE